jgi:hypothetical protein
MMHMSTSYSMSGSNTICVATVLLETGMVPMHEPETRFKLVMPGGVIEVRAECRDGKCLSITIRNAPAFVDRLDADIEVEGLGTPKGLSDILVVGIAEHVEQRHIPDGGTIGLREPRLGPHESARPPPPTNPGRAGARGGLRLAWRSRLLDQVCYPFCRTKGERPTEHAVPGIHIETGHPPGRSYDRS